MRKGLKRVLSLVFAVVLMITACVPVFAAAQENTYARRNAGITVKITKPFKDSYASGSVAEVSAKVVNNSDKVRDIKLSVSPSPFIKLTSINGKRLFKMTIVIKDVQPGEEKTVTVKGIAERKKLEPYYLDIHYSVIFGQCFVWAYSISDILKTNVAASSFNIDSTGAGVKFTAKDVTPEPETETETEPETKAPVDPDTSVPVEPESETETATDAA